MQLVEQRLELGVGDVITRAAQGLALHLRLGSGRFGLDRIERVEQLFELGVGDVRLGRHGLGRSLDHRRRGIGAGGLCQARQGRQQLRGGRGHGTALTHLAEHAVDRVQCFEHHVHQFRVDPALTFAQDVEHVLGDVAALHQLVQLKEAGAPLQCGNRERSH